MQRYLKVLHFFWQICAWILLVKEKQLLRYIVKAGQEIGSQATKYRWGVKKERVGRKKYMYISGDPLITASFSPSMSFRLSPLHPLDRAVCSEAPPSALVPSFFNPFYPSGLSPSAAGFSQFNWFLKTRWRSRMWFERMQFFPPLTPRSQPTLGSLTRGLSPPLSTSEPFPINQHPQSSRIFFFPLSRTTTRTRRRRGQRRKRRKRATGNVGSGRGRPEIAGRPRGKGMQDIAAPRDTRGRNLYDGAGDVLQSRRSPPTTKSLGTHAWMAHSPWLVSRKVSIYSDYSFSSRARSPRLHSRPKLELGTRASARSFYPSLPLRSFTYLSTYLHAHGVCGTKISFFTGAWDQDDGLRSRAAEKCFLRCRFLSLWLS